MCMSVYLCMYVRMYICVYIRPYYMFMYGCVYMSACAYEYVSSIMISAHITNDYYCYDKKSEYARITIYSLIDGTNSLGPNYLGLVRERNPRKS
jgi:hypothetical protein